jgi:hypothetical protein
MSIAVSVALVSAVLVVASPIAQTADAADLAGFDPGFIITDDVFYDSGTMSQSAIQSFLNSKASSCNDYLVGSTKYTCLKNYVTDSQDRAADSRCSAITGKSAQSAAAIIYTAAKACGINPQVILVTLQKENGLITSAKPPGSYRTAMGYGCPDTAPCDTQYYGFFNQVYKASSQFIRYGQSTGYRYNAGTTVQVGYHPNTSCGSTAVYIRNKATAALYNYTPYQPNAAALKAGYSVGDECSSYGNRNFFNYFSDWFGSPANLLKNASFQNKLSSWVPGSNGSISRGSYTNSDKAHSGSRYAAIKTSRSGRLLQQTVERKTTVGQVLTAGLWVRAVSETTPVNGQLRLWTTGGKTDTTRTSFEAGPEWTYVTVDLPIEQSNHTGLRFAIQLDTTNQTLRIDTAELYVSAEQDGRAPLRVENTSVEGGTNGGWIRSDKSTVKLSRSSTGGAKSGRYYLASSTTSAGRYFYQRIARVTEVGQAYTAGMWLRSGSSTENVEGRVKLLGMGGSSEATTTNFSVGPEWTYVTVTLNVENPSHKSLRIYVYLDQVGTPLHMDAITLTPNLYTRDSSFETGSSGLNSLPAGTTVERVANAEFDGAGLSGYAPDGQSLLKVSGAEPDVSYIRLDKTRVLSKGNTYTVSYWVKSAIPGVEQVGTVTLEARVDDALSEETTAEFTATDQWQQVRVSHTITQPLLQRLRSTIRLGSDSGVILVDGVLLR